MRRIVKMIKVLFLSVLPLSVLAVSSCAPVEPDPSDDPSSGDDTVTVKVERITLNVAELTLNQGETCGLRAEVYPDTVDFRLVWSSSDDNVVTVDDNGTVKAVSAGLAVVTAACDSVSADCRIEVLEPKSFPVETVLIPAGTFIMGSPETEPNRGDDEMQHQVTISQSFYMGKYEITNKQFAEFLNDIGCPETGYSSTEEYGTVQFIMQDEWGCVYGSNGWTPAEGFENNPVICVTWYGANEYAKWVGGSLPTEAQWEYACRGGQTESLPFGIGDGSKLTYEIANFRSNYPYDAGKGGRYEDPAADYRATTTEVGSFEANGYGLYDMHGNVYEYCSDWKADYPEGPVTDPHGPDSPTPDQTKVIRGGSWFIFGDYCRSAERDHFYMDMFDIHVGFRVVFPS